MFTFNGLVARSYHRLTHMNRGVVLSPAVIPVALTVSWSKLTKPAVILGPILGAILGMAAWMIGCWKILGWLPVHALEFICGFTKFDR